MTKVQIYTDGACRGNPGPGGWAALLIAGNTRRVKKKISKAEKKRKTNKRIIMKE